MSIHWNFNCNSHWPLSLSIQHWATKMLWKCLLTAIETWWMRIQVINFIFKCEKLLWHFSVLPLLMALIAMTWPFTNESNREKKIHFFLCLHSNNEIHSSLILCLLYNSKQAIWIFEYRFIVVIHQSEWNCKRRSLFANKDIENHHLVENLNAFAIFQPWMAKRNFLSWSCHSWQYESSFSN